MAARAESPAQVLAKLRRLVLALPDTVETKSWGHPNFRVKKGSFVAFHEDRAGVPTIWLRVEPLAYELLRDDPRVSQSSHGMGRWIGVPADRRVDWAFVRELAQDGHALLTPEPRAARPRPAARTRAGRI